MLNVWPVLQLYSIPSLLPTCCCDLCYLKFESSACSTIGNIVYIAHYAARLLRTEHRSRHCKANCPGLLKQRVEHVASSAGSKRGRGAWEDCEDVEELKQHLSKQQDQIDKLRKEKAELTKALKASEDEPTAASPQDLSAQAAKICKSLASNLNAQMVYKSKHSKSRISADVPNLTLAQVRHMNHRIRASLLTLQPSGSFCCSSN